MKTIVEVDSWKASAAAAQPLRYQVFCVEQGVPVDMEWDEWDALSLHAIARTPCGKVCGTGRLLPDGRIGRMAVEASCRGLGVGGSLLRALMDAARKRGDREVVLHAQTAVEAFYLAHGFAREGEEFVEAGIRHVVMRRVFT